MTVVAAAALDDVAAVAQRLAVLLAAGIAPERAWQFVAAPASASPAAKLEEGASRKASPPESGALRAARASEIVRAAARAAERARDVAAAIAEECALAPPFGSARDRAVAWGLFAATWTVAVRSGAPLAATLQSFAESIRRAAALHRELSVAFAAPKSTARLVGFLPIVALGFGLILGFDTLHVLTATPVGWACLAVGFGLMYGSGRWSRRLLAAAEPTQLVPGLEAELVAVAMGSGVSVARARELVASALAEYAPVLAAGQGAGADAAAARAPGVESPAGGMGAVDTVLELAARAGVPTVGLLRAEAERQRAETDASGRAAVASVAVRLVVPLAVCALPAFMVLGVVPVLVALFASSGITFG